MSNFRTAVSVALGLAVLLGGTALGRRLGLPQVAAVGVGLLPALLLSFPLVRRLYKGRLKFTSWALVVAVTAAAALLLGALIH